jgi:formylmethanofuran dehydrogenase subunit C
MRICANASGREIDIERENGKEKQINNKLSSNGSNNLNTSTHMRIGLSKNISEKKGNVNIWLGIELKKAVVKAGVNLSEFVRNKLLEELKNRNIKIEHPDPELVIRVRCPFCNSQRDTSSILTVRCSHCGRFFKVFRKRGHSRIVAIVKGNISVLNKLYYQMYKR